MKAKGFSARFFLGTVFFLFLLHALRFVLEAGMHPGMAPPKRSFLGFVLAPRWHPTEYYKEYGPAKKCAALFLNTLLGSGAREIGGDAQPPAEGIRPLFLWEWESNWPAKKELVRAYNTANDLFRFNIYNGGFILPSGIMMRAFSYFDFNSPLARERLRELADILKESGLPVIFLFPPCRAADHVLFDDVFSYRRSYYLAAMDYVREALPDAGILDLHTLAKEKGLSPHEIFYSTDHHPAAVLYAKTAREIAVEIGRVSGLELDLEALGEENFASTVKKKSFLGSIGKKRASFFTRLDDFDYTGTKLPCKFKISIYGKKLEGALSGKTGGAKVLYKWQGTGNYPFRDNLYGGYAGGDHPAVEIENLSANESPAEVMFVSDSYDNPLICQLAPGLKRVVSFDRRHASVSLVKAIERFKPKAIIVYLSYIGSSFK